MVRLVIFGILFVLFVLLVRSFFSPSAKKQGEVPRETEMVQDPNCETYIPKMEAIHKKLSGADYFFCSEKCAEEFLQKNG